MSQAAQSTSGGETYHDKDCDFYLQHVERRLVLIGKTGTGKSTLGNALLGAHTFNNDGAPMKSNTDHCQPGRCKSNNGKVIWVVDTPGLMDTRREPNKTFQELCSCTSMVSPGPHVFCLLIRCDNPFTQEDIDTLNEYCNFFGEEIFKYLIVVFTHKPRSNVTSDGCIKCLPVEFQEKLLSFEVKAMSINSIADREELKEQIQELFALVEHIITRNNNGYYSNEKFQAAEKAYRERAMKLQQLMEKELNQRRKEIEAYYDEREKRFTEQVNALTRKLQEERHKLEHQQSKRDKAKLLKRIKSLEENLRKELERKDKCKEERILKIAEIDKKAMQDLQNRLIEDRNKVREDIGKIGLTLLVGTAALAGVGLGAYFLITGGITSAVGIIGFVIKSGLPLMK